MNEILTAKQLVQAKFPSRLEVYRERDKRHALNVQQKKELFRLEKGHAGEHKVLDMIEKYGEKHWNVLTNIWLNEYGSFEIDILLSTLTEIYTLEVKNYDGDFEYAESQCLYEGKIISQNPISQAQRATINFQNIINGAGLNSKVNGMLIFTGSNCEAKIYDKVNGLKVLTMNQLRNDIRRIAAQEKEDLFNNKQQLDINQLKKIIEMNEMDEQFPPEIIKPSEIKKLRNGIMCANCGSFYMDTIKSYMVCNCGLLEPREMAIVRTICEYGVIHFNEDFISSKVHQFLNGALSKGTTVRYLKQYFGQIGNKRGAKYPNSALPFNKIRHTFPFERPMYMRLEVL